jgi:S1-C subfamily serine protease
MKRLLMLGIGFVAVAAAPAGAQEPTRAGGGTIQGMSSSYRYVTARPHLGFSVNTRGAASDTLGARVESVTPGSPAFRAGIRTGDIITHLNNRPLVVTAPPGIRTLSPGTRLLELAAQINPKDTVALRFRRGTAARRVSLVAEPRRDITIYYEEPAGQEHALRELRQRVEEARGQTMTLDRNRALLETALSTYAFAPFGNLQLAPLNDDLGRYFGTSEGILVISVAGNSPLSLRGGDVVLRVDGRAPESPAHLLRILGSYGPGEELRLEIFRDRKRRTVSGNVGTLKETFIAP